MLTARDVFNKTREMPEEVRPFYYICGPSTYSYFAGVNTNGVSFEIFPDKEKAMARGDELGEEGKKFCFLMPNQAIVYAPQPNKKVRVVLVAIEGENVVVRPVGVS
jgi:hypothetical protein